jgi:molybdopterin molybdotransferase
MISVSQALSHLFDLSGPMPVEDVALSQASGRVLARDVAARRNQPPFAASAMDGYAVDGSELSVGTRFQVIGEAAAGQGFDGTVGPGQAVRIFTGAPVPQGAAHVVIQEDVTSDGNWITISDDQNGSNIRPAGGDFTIGETIHAPRLIRPADVALMAAMNIDRVPVSRKPRVALIPTGNELVQPGEVPGPDQIVASNSYGLQALFRDVGAQVQMLPIARDRMDSLRMVMDLAQGCDLIVTIGGASVGDHDLVAQAMGDAGMERAFYKVAMRPGKPLMAGRLGSSAMIGLPGNPVSAMVCGHLFVVPVLRQMLGLGQSAAARLTAPLARDVAANGPREHYMRAQIIDGAIDPAPRQDSALLSVLADAAALLVRPPHAPAAKAGELAEYIPL